MTVLRNLLIALVALEVLGFGYLAWQRAQRMTPQLPAVQFDDPLIHGELQQLAKQAESGGSAEWQELGEALLGEGYYTHAEAAFAQAVNLNPENSLAEFSRAFCLDRTGRIPESNTHYKRSAAMATADEQSVIGSPEHSAYQIARNALRLEDAAAAEKMFAEQLAFFPSAYQYAKLLVRSGRFEEARTIIDDNLVNYPRSLKFMSLRLAVREALGDSVGAAKAEQDLDRSEYRIPIDFNTDFVTPLNERHGISRAVKRCAQLSEEGNNDALAECLTSVISTLSKTDHGVLYRLKKNLIEVEFQRKNPDSMLTCIQELHDLGIQDADLLQMQGAALSLKGDPDAAAQLWLTAAQMAPNVPLHTMLSQYFSEKGDEVQATHHAGEAALLQTKIHYWGNQLPQARQAVEQAKQITPKSAPAWYYSGEIHLAQGETQAALADYHKCIELAPTQGTAHRRIQQLSGPPADSATLPDESTK